MNTAPSTIAASATTRRAANADRPSTWELMGSSSLNRDPAGMGFTRVGAAPAVEADHHVRHALPRRLAGELGAVRSLSDCAHQHNRQLLRVERDRFLDE